MSNIILKKGTKFDVILHGNILASCDTKAEAEAVQAENPHSVVRYFAEPDSL